MKRINLIISIIFISLIQLSCSKESKIDYTQFLPKDATDVITQRIRQGIDYSIYLKATVSPEGFKVFCDNLKLSKEPNRRAQSDYVDESIREWWLISNKDSENDIMHDYYTRNVFRQDNLERISDTLSAFYYSGSVYFKHTNF
jgi:hypothetical protein